MTILTLNIWGGRRHKALVEFVRKQSTDVDVFCFQEINSGAIPVTADQLRRHQEGVVEDMFEQIQAVLPAFTGLMAPKQDNYGNAMFVRSAIPVTNHATHFLYGQRDGLDGTNYSTHGVNLLEVTLTYADSPLRVMTTHGYWERDEGEDKPPRDQQISKILELIEQSNTPVVLGGDFNMNTRTNGIARLSQRLTNLGQQHGYATTRPAFCAYHGTVADYLFASPELEVSSFAVLPDEVSDHLALRATVHHAT